MTNPNGPYPGRQIFVGLTQDGNPALAYFVSGRSPGSRERKATRWENTIIIGPLGDVAYDSLKHYTALQNDTATGMLALTNGIQTQAIFETYKLLYNVGSEPDTAYLKLLMEGAAFEPDALNTPRIAAVLTGPEGNMGTVQMVSVIERDAEAFTARVEPEAGVFTGVSTYAGDLENPLPFDTGSPLPRLKVEGKTAAEIAEYVYGISEATSNGEDIRVCAIGGVYSKEKNDWDLAIINRHTD